MKTSGLFIHRYAAVLLCSMLLLFACSKDEPSTEQDEPNAEKTKLVLTTSSIEVEKGDEVTFCHHCQWQRRRSRYLY